MLQDPENPSEEWEGDVWAKTLAEARAKCEAIADPMTEVLSVTQAGKTPTKRGDYRFICWFRTEVEK
jgi:hypothetical protein